MNIKTVIDSKRGCGWRKPGGLYLRADGPGGFCGKLPLLLEVCSCCHGGIKASRGWTWIDPRPLFKRKQCSNAKDPLVEKLNCTLCPLHKVPAKAGLLWVGGEYYKTPADWLEEAYRLGVSRRISAVPRNFKLGEDWVMMAHREAIAPKLKGEPKRPGIFHVFRPTAIEYVVKGDEAPAELERMVERGITPVRVVKEGEFPNL